MARGHKASRLDPIRTATELDIAWAAGIYEGEGTCCAKPTTRTCQTAKFGERKYLSVADYLSVSQKDPEILYRLRDLFGGSVYQYTLSKNLKYAGQTFCRWTLHGQRAREFAILVYPWLSMRRKAQIDKVHASLPYPVETVRADSPGEENKIQSDLHGDMQRSAEMTDPPSIQ